MLYATVAVLAIILDQIVKYVVESKVALDAIGTDVVRLIPGFIHVTNIHNEGAAFSFLQGARWFFVALCVIFAVVVIYVLVKDIISTPVARWMAVIVLAGAIGNCIDRIVCGYVVDMFEFEFVRFPVFNIADIYITLGAIGLCICLLAERPRKAAADGTAQPGEPESAPAPAAEKRPRFRKKQYEIPVPAAPAALDPNDPFAEWERRANAPAPAAEQPAPSAAHVTYTQPVGAAEPVAPPAPQPAPSPAPAAPASAPASAPAPAPAAEQPAPAADEFDLDSILAEFKDL